MFFHSYQKKQDKQPEIVPEEAAIVERIYEMFLAGQGDRPNTASRKK